MDLEPLLTVNEMPVNVAVLDTMGSIIGVNRMWRDFAEANGSRMAQYGVGLNYLDYCESGQSADGMRDDLVRLLNGDLAILTAAYPCHSPGWARWFLLIGLPLSHSRRAGVVLMHANLTDLLPVVFSVQQLEAATRHLSESDASLALQTIADVVQRAVTQSIVGILSQRQGNFVLSARSKSPSAAHLKFEQAGLSNREREVFEILGHGKSNEAIAAALGVSQNTIKVHVSKILKRLGVRTRTECLSGELLNPMNHL
jgi:DNA-binding CsgD family transcriptional regulator